MLLIFVRVRNRLGSGLCDVLAPMGVKRAFAILTTYDHHAFRIQLAQRHEGNRPGELGPHFYHTENRNIEFIGASSLLT